jgi:hypothetical protein
MSVRVGESWTAPNGHRRQVSMGLGTYLTVFGVRSAFTLPFLLLWWLILAEVWVCAEIALLAVSGVLALTDLARRTVRPGDITVTSLRWNLFVIDMKGARP